MLQLLELVDEEKITMLKEQFSEHDKDGSGRLDRDDLSIIAKEKEMEKMKKKLILQGVKGDALTKKLADAERAIDEKEQQPSPSKGAVSVPSDEQMPEDTAKIDIEMPPAQPPAVVNISGDEEKDGVVSSAGCSTAAG